MRLLFSLLLLRRAQAMFDFTDAPFDRCATAHALSLDDSLFVFVLSEDSTLWQKRQQTAGQPWSSWQLIGAGNRFAGKPAVVRGVDGRLRIFVRGIDHAVYYSSQLEPNGELWDGWTCFGGQFAGGPVATVNAQGFVDVFAVGRDAALYTMAQTLNGTEAAWSEWSFLGGNLTGPPSTVTDAEGMVHDFARGDDRSLMHMRQIADLPYAFVRGANASASQREWLHRGVGFELRWSKWQSLGGVLASGPVATVGINQFGLLEVYARFADKSLWRLGHEASFEQCFVGWGQWHMVGGLLAGPPAVGMSMLHGASVVFARQADKQLYYKTQVLGHNGTEFEPDWKLMHGAFGSGPSLVQKSSGLFEVLMQGVDRQIYHSAQTERGAFFGFGSFNTLGGRTRQFAC